MSQDKFKSARAAFVTGILVGTVIAATACSYSVSFRDCEVSCQGSDTCPSDFTCLSGLCREGSATGACGSNSGNVTLRETTDDKVNRNLVFGCNNADSTTPEGSWYRVFSLSDAGIQGTFHVDHVTIGICFAIATTPPNVQVKVGTYSGGATDTMLDLTKVTPIQMTTVAIPPTMITELVDAPIIADVPGGKNLIVEIEVADLNGTGEQVVIGSTASGQTQAGYLRFPQCSINQPTSTTAAGHDDAHFIITVTGSD